MENIPIITTKKKIESFKIQQKTLEQQNRMRKLLEEANQMKLDTGLKSQFQGGMSDETFTRSIPLLAKNIPKDRSKVNEKFIAGGMSF